MTITVEELAETIQQLKIMRVTTPWYKPLVKFRLVVMIETLVGVVEWIAQKANQRSCGCANHTNHYTN